MAEDRKHTKAVAKAMANLIQKDQKASGGNPAGSGDATQKANVEALRNRTGGK